MPKDKLRILMWHLTGFLPRNRVTLHKLRDYVDLNLIVPPPKGYVSKFGETMALDEVVDEKIPLRFTKPLIPFLSFRYSKFQIFKDLNPILRELKPDIVHIISEPWFSPSVQLNYFARRIKIPTVINVKENKFARKGKIAFGIRKLLTRSSGRKAFFVAVSSKTQEELIKVGISASKIFRGQINGVDVKIFQSFQEEERNYWKRYFGIPADSFVYGYVGRMTRDKGVGELLEVAKHMSLNFDPSCLLLVGRGPLITVAASMKNYGVRVFDNIYSPSELARFYNIMDVYIANSFVTNEWEEQDGASVAEAMACGVPVLGSYSGCIPDMLGSGGGLLCSSTKEIIKNLCNYTE